MRIRDIMPQLILGKPASIPKMLAKTEKWYSSDIDECFDKIPERYEKLSGDKMSSFTGLVIFTEIVNLYREIPAWHLYYETFVAKAQKKVMYYHELQFKQKPDDKSDNT